MKIIGPSLVIAWLFPAFLLASEGSDQTGFEVGILHVQPQVYALAAYDNRVVASDDGSVEGDLYGEVGVSVDLKNTPAQYGLSGRAGFGYRAYDDYADINDEFYDVGLGVESRNNPLKLGASSTIKKTLDYDTTIDPVSGQTPPSILTPASSTRIDARCDVGYEKQLSGKAALMPSYDYWYYSQEIQKEPDAEWQSHRANLQLGYGFTEKTIMTLSASYGLQMNDHEKGSVGTVAVGANGRASDKTKWEIEIGVSAADYEESGTEETVVSKLRLVWNPTERTSAYVYGGNDFQLGRDSGSAEIIYRLGYGADWRIASRWSLKAQVLHDYEEQLNKAIVVDDGVRHFFTAQADCDLTRRLVLSLAGRYIHDELDEAQTIVGIGVGYNY